MQATINLSNAATPSSKVNATTNTDGSFDLKSQGEWNSNNYYLEITEVNSSYIRMSYTINNRQNIDVGNILRGSYTFYCKVTLNPIDNSAIDFYGITAVQTHFNAGTATQITSYNHCVTANNPNTYDGDFIYITGVIGLLNSTITAISQATQAVITSTNTFSVGNLVTISGVVGMTQLNGNTYEVVAVSGTSITINVNSTTFNAYISGGIVTSAFNGQIGKVIGVIDKDNFIIDFPAPTFTTTYLGLGVFAKLSQPLMQTKQFNPYWEQGRQVRLSTQKYLLDDSYDGQITVNINLSQDPNTTWNTAENDGVIYSQIMYTCPESTNLGLTPFNTNLQMPTARSQYQIWHRFNTSLIGDSVQIGLTLSSQETAPGLRDAQMYSLDYATSEITLHGMHLTVQMGPHLA